MAKKRTRWVRIGVVGAVLCLGALAFAALRTADPWSRAATQLDRIGAPPHVARYLGSHRGGGLFCIDACPSVARSYDVGPSNLGELRSVFGARLNAAGYRLARSRSCVVLGLGSTVRITCTLAGTRSGYNAEIDLIVAPRATTPTPRLGVAQPIDVPQRANIERVDVSVAANRVL
jgi:hypothetical protein